MQTTLLRAPLFGLLLLLFGCNSEYLQFDKIQSGEIDPAFAVPLAKASLAIDDVLKNDTSDILLFDDDNGTYLGLIYVDTLEALTASNLFVLPDFSENESFSLNNAAIVGFETLGSFSVSQTNNIIYDVQSTAEISEVNFSSGTLAVDVNSTFQHPGELILTIPSLTASDGSAYTTTVPFDGTSSVPVQASSSTELSGYTLMLGAGGDIDVEFEFSMTNSGNATAESDELTITFGLSQAEYSTIRGDFKNTAVDFPSDSVLMRIFGNFSDGTFTLTNPTVTFNFANGFGIPFNFQFNDFFTRNVTTGEERDLLQSADITSFDINEAATPGDVATTSLEFNNENTNGAMSNVIEPTPKFVIYNITGETNPGSPTGNDNFVSANSELQIVSEVLLPLEGFGELNLGDTITYSEVVSEDQVDQVKSILLRIAIDNGFPLEAEMSATVFNYDEVTNTWTELFDILGTTSSKQMIIESATIDPVTFKVDQARELTTDITLSRNAGPNKDINQVKLLTEGNRIVISTSLTTTDYDSQVIKVYNDYSVGVRLGTILQFDADPTNLF